MVCKVSEYFNAQNKQQSAAIHLSDTEIKPKEGVQTNTFKSELCPHAGSSGPGRDGQSWKTGFSGSRWRPPPVQ